MEFLHSVTMSSSAGARHYRRSGTTNSQASSLPRQDVSEASQDSDQEGWVTPQRSRLPNGHLAAPLLAERPSPSAVTPLGTALPARHPVADNLLGNTRLEVWLFLSAVKADHGLRRFCLWYEVFSVSLVLATVAQDIAISVPSLEDLPDRVPALNWFTRVVALIFTAEYVLRFWSCMECPDFGDRGPVRGRLRWAFQPLPLIDGLVVSAFNLSLLSSKRSSAGLPALRMVRVLRLVALLKVDRSTNAISQVLSVFAKKKSELAVTLTVALVLVVMSATLMYYAENEAQPDSFSSIPAAMWWSTATLTTVGYGDVVPKTSAGKFLGGLIAFFGVGLFALPAGILGSGFVEGMQESEEERNSATRSISFQMPSEDQVRPDLQELQHSVEKLGSEVAWMRSAIERYQGDQAELRRGQEQIMEALRLALSHRVSGPPPDSA